MEQHGCFKAVWLAHESRLTLLKEWAKTNLPICNVRSQIQSVLRLDAGCVSDEPCRWGALDPVAGRFAFGLLNELICRK